MHFTKLRKGFAKAANAVLVMLAVALQWYAHTGGLLKTPDSCSYLAAIKTFEGYEYWPPLFPILLMALGDFWYWIHLALAAWCSWLIIIETDKVIKDKWLALVCKCSIILGVHLLLIGTFLWSELLFLLLLIYFFRTVERDRFVVAIILGFFLCLERNAGLFFVTAASIWLWNWRRSAILFIVSTSGFWAWNIYTSKLEQAYFVSSLHNFQVMAGSIAKAFVPIGSGLVFIVIAGGVTWLLRSEFSNPKIRLWCLSTAVYLAGLTVLFKIAVHDDDRYAAVVIPFITILVFRAVEIALSKQTSRARTVLLIVAICWLAYPLSRTVKNAVQWHNLSFTSYFCAIEF